MKPTNASEKTKTSAGGESPMSFENLLADIRENPERILEPSITPEQILALQKGLNPYAYVAGDSGDPTHKRMVAASCTNLRAEYLQRFTMTSLVGFIFRMLDEWEVPAEARRWISKAGAKRARAREGAGPTPTPDDLLLRAEALRELALVAKSSALEAAEASDAARAADDALLARMADTGEGSAALETQAAELLKSADAALAKARGMHYAAAYELRKQGLDADGWIDAVAAVARQHPEVAAVIDRDPIRRPPPGQMEIPAAVAKGVIGNFLRAWFEYNPDAHVRSAYDEFISAAQAIDPGDPCRLPLSAVRAAAPRIEAAADREAVEALTASREAYNAAAYMLRNEQAAAALQVALAAPERFRRYICPIPADSPARPAVDIIPPQDTFHRWRYYTEVNFEELRTATEAIYHEKPDLDWALILYEYFEGTPAEVNEAFESFRDQHQDEVISDIKGLDFGGWTLLGDFKENREKITFYNKHTDVLKRILDRHAEDKKLGQDLMRNRVRQLKAKNIQADGPDAPGLAEYQQAGSALATLGAERVIGREEMLRLERAKGDLRAAKELEALEQYLQTIRELSAVAKVRELEPDEERRLKDAQAGLVIAREMIEVPEDAIQVDVWDHQAQTGKLARTKFYTKAEAPAHTAQLLSEQAEAMANLG